MEIQRVIILIRIKVAVSIRVIDGVVRSLLLGRVGPKWSSLRKAAGYQAELRRSKRAIEIEIE